VKVDGVQRRTIWRADDGCSVEIIDQTRLPHEFATRRLGCVDEVADAIRSMQVRGAPLIGAAAAFGLCLQARVDASDAAIGAAAETLRATRPTAVNLAWALDRVCGALRGVPAAEREAVAWRSAQAICDDDVATCRAIGEHGVTLLEAIWERHGRRRPVEVLTHCNAGWLATLDWGTALAPIYVAQERGIDVHVWVDETRPRNQGAGLTAWELLQQGVPHTVIADNVGGHLMQHGRVDLCLTGTDRTTSTGDVCNKIGTYLKALAARDNGVPFHVALPHSSIDWSLGDGLAEIPIEERDGGEVRRIAGRSDDGSVRSVSILPDASPVANYAFDVTPARLVTGLVTERGLCEASRAGLLGLYPERG
jgi:methylthioribose-1-phosphate isomerase